MWEISLRYHPAVKFRKFVALALFVMAGCQRATLAPSTATVSHAATPSQESLQQTPTPPRIADISFLEKPHEDALRVLSYNVNWDSIFEPGDPQNHDLRTFSKGQAFDRVIRALNPDIVCLQEINPERDPAQISARIERILGDGSTWQAVSTRDNVIATRFDLEAEGYGLIPGSFVDNVPQAAALVDLPDALYGPVDIFVICAHFKAGGSLGDILQRVRQGDMIMSNVRDLTTPGGEFDVLPGTPLLVMGDFNIYETDDHEHLHTLLTGDINREERYGPDFSPDWDGSALADAQPSHNGAGSEYYTWRDDQAFFETGLLDRIIYSDSVLSLSNSFILNTAALSPQALEQYGLQEYDVVLNPATGYFDHLPLVVDFAFLDG